MTPRQIEHFLAVYGTDLDQWPEGKRIAAQHLLAGSAAAKQIYWQARALEQALDLWTVEPNGQPLAARIIEQTRQLPQEKPPVFSPRGLELRALLPLWPSAIALGLAFLLGLLVGLSDFINTPPSPNPLDMLDLAVAGPVETITGL